MLFDTQEVRSLLNCLRAIDDPSDEVSVVAALRSPAFACSDVDLLRWRDARGSWNYRSALLGDRTRSNESSETHRQNLATDTSLSSVRSGLLKLREYNEMRQTTGVSRLISEFIQERRLDELDLAESRPRETWRRRRFLTEQARTLEFGRLVSPDAQPLNLYQFIQWVELQQEERARIAEVVVPDTDDDAVRIMTMHTSKGLEFPVVFVLGLAQNPRRNDRSVFFDPVSDMAEVKLDSISSQGYSRLQELEDAHGEAEQVRLAYVAMTRARDHLFMSMYRSTTSRNRQSNGVTSQIEEHLPEMEGLYADAAVDAFDNLKLVSAVPDAVEIEGYDPEIWLDDRNGDIQARSLPSAVTATQLARTAGNVVDPEEIEDKDSEPDDEQSIIRGRGGTAFGSALHAVLQEFVEMISEDLPLDEGSTVDDILPNTGDVIDNLAETNTVAHGVTSSRSELAVLAGRALRHPAVSEAFRAPRLWSEIPVAGKVETERGPIVIEGIIDLLYQDHDGKLVIVDHKSDYVPNASTLSAKMDIYRWQGAAYALAVGAATGMKVKDVQLLFVRANEVLSVPDLDRLLSELPEIVLQS
ncbi:MAG: PD-(D/E)XK nuclease family protein [Dehalococcoidia bacterium]|nr:PD-(D/E)XK nuclease family protein [Dehalococcoidia bacterium]